MAKEVLSPEAKAAELEKYYTLTKAALRHQEKWHIHPKTEPENRVRQEWFELHYGILDKHYKKGALDKLIAYFKDICEFLRMRYDYIHNVETELGIDVGLKQAYFGVLDKIISQKIISNYDDYELAKDWIKNTQNNPEWATIKDMQILGKAFALYESWIEKSLKRASEGIETPPKVYRVVKQDPISKDGFWEIINTAHSAHELTPDETAWQIQNYLAKDKPNYILGFDQQFHHCLRESYTGKLWGAAYLINGGCSDDGFEYFRCWLILQGREVFENAIKDPDSLASYVEQGDLECEEALHIAAKAYDQAGLGSVDDFYANRWETETYPQCVFDWTEETLDAHYPQLAERFNP